MIIDFHTHCFNDALAPKAMQNLMQGSLYPPHSDGTLGGLKASMKRAGIDVSVVCNIAVALQHVCVGLRFNSLVAFQPHQSHRADS